MRIPVLVLLIGLSVAKAQDDPCDGTPLEITESGTEISSPGNPDQYPPDSDCAWIIRAQGVDDRVSVSFSSFLLEDCIGCNCDYVELFDGEDDTGESLGRFCGSESPFVIEASGMTMFIRFVSDGSVEGTGFQALVEFETINRACEAGGAIIENDSGFITSPEYPGDYPNNQFCSWTFIQPEGMAIELTINDFQLQEGCRLIDGPATAVDWVRFYNDDGVTLETIGFWYGVIGSGDFTYTSYSNQAIVRFSSDGAVRERGFNISYRAVSDDITTRL